MTTVYSETETPFQHPFSCILSGASQSGKTVFIKNFIQHLDIMVSPRITDVIISFTEDQPGYHEMKCMDSRVRLVRENDYDIWADNTLIIIDDQMTSSMKDNKIQELFTRGVHHKSISVVLITQDLFPPEKYARTVRRNANYLVVFRSPTFRSQVTSLGRQLYPGSKNVLAEAYCKATELPYTYLFVNLHPTCHEHLRLRSGILPFEDQVVYFDKLLD
jgi:hypothetical protein